MMSELVDPKPASDGKGAKHEVDTIPIRTQRTFDGCMARFAVMLSNQSRHNMTVRNSKTPTDSDVEKAFRDLTDSSTPPRLRWCIGDAAMVAGGVMLPLWEITWLLTLSGSIIVLLGLWARESTT